MKAGVAVARKKTSKPKSPEDIAAERIARRERDFDAVNLQPEAARLVAYQDVTVAHAERAKVDGARRVDAFLALRDGMQPGAYDAARRLEKDMAIRAQENDKGRAMQRVDNDGGRDVMDTVIQAGRRVDAVFARIGERDQWLLTELIQPAVERSGGWRGIVAHVTGEENPVAQGAAVRAACANLFHAYKALEQKQPLAA
jgi:hypothetical protein